MRCCCCWATCAATAAAAASAAGIISIFIVLGMKRPQGGSHGLNWNALVLNIVSLIVSEAILSSLILETVKQNCKD